MKFNIKLNIKSIIKAEQLLKKPFQSIDFTSEPDLNALLYCCVMANNPETFTFSEFLNILKAKPGDFFRAFDKECNVLTQFNQEPPKSDEAESDLNTPPYIKDIAATLIVDGGIDANFIMSLSLNDLPIYLKAYENTKRQQLQNDRLWSYMTVVPHIDTKKCSSDRDFYPFPWEVEQMRVEELEYMEKNEKELDMFLELGMEYITGKQH